jgi:Uma2 family endonuclease
MVNISATTKRIAPDRWVERSWEEFIVLAEDPIYEKARFYYDRGYIKIEMTPIGYPHGRRNSVAYDVVSLFALVRNLRILKLTNCSFRKIGEQECQPDVAFYIGDDFKIPDQTSNSPIDLQKYSPPNLAIEIASTSLSDDLGEKRLLYERLGVNEYWVINTALNIVIAFSIANNRSGQIRESIVLPGLAIATVDAALQRSMTEDDGTINRWLWQTFS